jgi:hypothetical protein
MAEAIAEHHK